MKRSAHNPVLLPDPKQDWECFAAFNGSLTEQTGDYHLFYRAISSPKKVNQAELRLSSIGYARSRDGIQFTERRPFLQPSTPWDQYGCEDPRVTFFEGKYIIFYTALGGFPFSSENIRIGAAITSDLRVPPTRHLVTHFNAKAMTLFPQRINGEVCALLTIRTEDPPSKIVLAKANEIEDFFQLSYWENWLENYQDFLIPIQRLNTDQVEVGSTPILTDEGWLIFYAHIQNYGRRDIVFGIEAALCDLDDPRKVIARTEAPILVPEASYERYGTVPGVIFPSSAAIVNEEIRLYYGAADTFVCYASAPLNEFLKRLSRKYPSIPKGIKLSAPLFTIMHESEWESKTVFNPGAFDDEKRTHLLYRAQGESWTSSLGYARLDKPDILTHRNLLPAYVPRAPFEQAKKPGFSGCEDPRMTLIGDRIFMLYTAYNGEDPPRVALTSILKNDFLNEKWENWAPPRLITAPNLANKDAALFPEKIGGYYWFLHRIEPDICIDWRESLEFDGETQWLEAKAVIHARKNSWEGLKIGANTPPLKTRYGWLFLYHGVSELDRNYRVGAILLDLHDPSKVVARSPYPILEPELDYEKKGVVQNVVFPCGWVRRGDDLWIYYGAADQVVSVAKISETALLKYLLSGTDL